MLLMLKIRRVGNVRFLLKSQLPDADSVLSHSPETPTEGKIYRRKIEPKGNGSVNLYWFHCMTTFLCPSPYDQNLQKSKFIPEKNTSEFTILFSENTWKNIRGWIVTVATYLLGFKARLHQWEEIWLKAIKYQDMTFGSGRTWSANCWHGWYKDDTGCFRILSLCHSCPLPVLL